MLQFLDNFLTSGHHFTENENLQKFRFSLLNSLLLIAALFTLLNYLVSRFHLITFSPLYENILLGYAIMTLGAIYLLRKKNFYIFVVNLTLVSTLALFYFALLTAVQDELRLIWFFLVVFASFIFIGKKYGLLLMLFILSSIFIINNYHDLGYSKLALFTFFNAFLIFTAFSYFFLEKIEKDSVEFLSLNDKLRKNVSNEVQQRQKQERMLLQQCRLASMGEMIDSIAHQWRQPLMNINAILMNMDRAIELKTKPDSYLEDKIDEVITLTTHMSQTIEDFRALLKTDKQKTHFFIDASINKALEIFEGPLKDINVQMKENKKLTFYGYNNELIQVIIILLSNAIDALKTYQNHVKNIWIDIEITEHNLSITIEDNAGGIEKKYIDKIFDPYFTTKDATGGTGMGLYISKIIIEQNMHGSLSVINTKKGAKFIILIPK